MTPVQIGLASPAIVTALAAICGSIIGGLTSGVSTWISQKHQDRRELLAKWLFHREGLFSDFIIESARLLVDASEHNVSEPKNLVPVYALLSRIRLSSSPKTLAIAEEVVRNIIGAYRQPNLTVEQIESRALNGDDPLKKFSEVCRAELESIRRQL